jgi:hypothetical protein
MPDRRPFPFPNTGGKAVSGHTLSPRIHGVRFRMTGSGTGRSGKLYTTDHFIRKSAVFHDQAGNGILRLHSEAQ